MSTPEEVDEFYVANYNRLINYLKNNKHGGDKVGVIPDAAVEILHDTYCYHKSNPKTFDHRFIWNVLKQRRLNYLRDMDSYDFLKDSFFKNYYVIMDNHDETLEELFTVQQMRGIIRSEISALRSKRQRDALTEHLIRGKVLSEGYERVILQRFRQKMIAKYGGDDG